MLADARGDPRCEYFDVSATRLVALSSLILGASAGVADAAAVFPTPGSVSASPFSQVSFRDVAREDIGRVTVRGSRSGGHAGVLRAHSDGQGASWVPLRRFSGGERVTVQTSLHVTGARDGDFSFRVAVWPGRVTIQKSLADVVKPGRVRRFKSRPDLIPPVLTVGPGSTPLAPGYVFTSPKAKNDTLQAGPMITDTRGRPVWFLPLRGIKAATDVRAQTYEGEPVITWWQGTSRQGIGSGEFVIVGQDYKLFKRVRLPSGYRADLHEFLITPQDTALTISYPVVKADLRSQGGSRDGQLVDAVVHEIDLKTGLVMFEWHSRGRIPLSDSFIAPERSPRVPWDYVHVNSVSLDSDGDILVSGRNTWAVYKLDRHTARIEWTLGGRSSSFKFGKGARFAWQHDAQRRADGALTLFDNSASPAVAKLSRALAIDVDEIRKTATLLTARTHPRRLLAATQGNHQTLPGGGALVGWGSRRYMTEYDAKGNVIWDARLSVGFESYRAYRSPWVGFPDSRPRVFAQAVGGGMDVYVSWNGATEVASWQVLGGSNRNSLVPIRTYGRTSFETRVPASRRTAFVAVRALSKEGRTLATSHAVRVKA